jgi:hypothetical protein
MEIAGFPETFFTRYEATLSSAVKAEEEDSSEMLVPTYGIRRVLT